MAPEVWQKLCQHYGIDCETSIDSNGFVSPKYSLSVDDNPVTFKRMFPDVSCRVGEEVSTTQGLEIVNTLLRIEQRLERQAIASPRSGLPAKPTYESDGMTRAAMPEWFVAHIKKIEVCTDYCTVALQDDLDDGWHILAICPQPGQRRPDYILGRL